MAPYILSDTETSYQLIRRLVAEYGVKHWKSYAAAFVFMAVSAAGTASIAYLMGTIVNKAYVDRSFHAIVVIGLFTIVIFCARGAATYFQAVILSRVGNAIIAENQRKLFDRLMHQNLGFFAERHSSEFLHRLSTGANSAMQVLNLLITAVGRDLLSLIGLAAVMVIQDPVMSLSAAVIAPPAMWMIRKLVRRVRAVAKAQFTGGSRLFETLQETIHGIRIVKAFTLEDRMRKRYYENVATVEYEANKMARVSNRSSPMMEALAGVAIAMGVIYGGYRTIEMSATPGEFFSFITAFLLAYEPAKRLARLNIELNAGLVGVRQLFEIIDAPSSEPSDNSKPKLAIDRARVEFKDVRFSYREDEPVLRGLSLVAEAGQMTALVGPSGGGKSTILNTASCVSTSRNRASSRSTGRISRTCRDTRCASRSPMSGRMCSCFTARSATTSPSARTDATEDEIMAAAKAANAHDFIMSFPKGYDTHTGEQGLQLSGGQRQRIAVARALIRDARLILLDEATAALDSKSERLVQDAIAHLTRGRTTIVIAHRLHTVAHADRIYVIEEGVVPNPAGTRNCCARAAAMRRSTDCNCRARNLSRPPRRTPE